MQYRVNGIYVVKYLNPDDMDGNGIQQDRRRVEGTIDAADEVEARAKVEQAVSERHFGCWSTEVTKLDLTAEPKGYIYIPPRGNTQ